MRLMSIILPYLARKIKPIRYYVQTKYKGRIAFCPVPLYTFAAGMIYYIHHNRGAQSGARITGGFST